MRFLRRFLRRVTGREEIERLRQELRHFDEHRTDLVAALIRLALGDYPKDVQRIAMEALNWSEAEDG